MTKRRQTIGRRPGKLWKLLLLLPLLDIGPGDLLGNYGDDQEDKLREAYEEIYMSEISVPEGFGLVFPDQSEIETTHKKNWITSVGEWLTDLLNLK